MITEYSIEGDLRPFPERFPFVYGDIFMNNTNTEIDDATMDATADYFRRCIALTWNLPPRALRGEISETKTPEKGLGYQATYTRRSSGSVAIDLNSISREYVSANTLDELNSILSTLSINQPGFSVLKIEKL